MNILLNELPMHDLPPKTIVAIDTELYGMRGHRLHWKNEGKFASMQFTSDGENVYVITDETMVFLAMGRLKHATHVYHNAYFDITHLRRWCDYPDHDAMYDTMLIEKLLYSGYYDSFGLADLARRYFQEIVDKEDREEFVVRTEMTPDMINYAAQDAILTYRIFAEQRKIISGDRKDVLRIWKNVDQPALYALVDINPTMIDVKEWRRLADEKGKRADEIKKEAEDRWNINIGSYDQVKRKLHAQGIKVSDTRDKSLRRVLRQNRKRDDDLIEKTLEFRHNSKRASTYGHKMANEMFEPDGTSYPGWKVSEAMTGRMSSAGYNLQNIPAEFDYRNCIVASPKHRILVTDYSAQEPRIVAYESKDSNLTKMTHIKGESIHVTVGRFLFDDPKLTKKDSRYKGAKGCNLGLSYGLTYVGLQRDINDKKEDNEADISRKDAQEIINRYFKKFPGVKTWIDRQRARVKNEGFVETRLGRRAWLNPYDWQSGNNALNDPIQGGAADITKIALAKIRKESYKRWGKWYCFGVVHDEIDFNVPIAIFEEHRIMVESIMINVAEKIYKGIAFEVESKWGDTWACKMEEE